MDNETPTAAFVFNGEIDPSIGDPLDGFTYLKTVRWESNRLPEIFSSDINPRIYDSNQTTSIQIDNHKCAQASSDRLPKDEWKSKFISMVTKLRKAYFEQRAIFEGKEDDTPCSINFPGLKDRLGWQRFCFGNPAGDSTSRAHEPTSEVMIRFDEVSVIKILSYHIKWFNSQETIEEAHLRWLFALLVCLDLPVEADMQADLRSLLVKCCQLRADPSPIEMPILAGLNMIITLLSETFGQKDIL